MCIEQAHHTDEESTFQPIFVVGNSRSGTTLMATILGRHPLVFRFEELHFFEELWNAKDGDDSCSRDQAIALVAKLLDIQRNGYLTRKDWHSFCSEADQAIGPLIAPIPITKLFQLFLKYETKLQKKQIACDQTPQNVLYVKEILEYYPDARIIHMVRDPRAVLLSQKKRWRRPFLAKNVPKKEVIRYWLNYHPITISQLWKANIRAMVRVAEDRRVCTLKYEDLLLRSVEETQKICQFLGIDYQADLLEVPQVNSSNEEDRPEKRGIDRQRANIWREGGLNQVELYWCQQINHSLMTKYDYCSQDVSPNPVSLLISAILCPIKLSFAILFSLRRMKSLGEAIRRRLS